MVIEATRKITGEYETDRAKFLGRSKTMHKNKTRQRVKFDLAGGS